MFEEIAQQSPNFFDDIRPIDGQSFSVIEHFPVTRLLPVHPFWPSSLVVHRDALLALGGWDEELRGVKCEDIDFVFRALSRFPLAIGWQPSVRYRCHANNDAGNTFENLKGRIHVWERLINNEPMSTAIHEHLSTALVELYRQLLWEAFLRKDDKSVLKAYAVLKEHSLSWSEIAKFIISSMRQRLS